MTAYTTRALAGAAFQTAAQAYYDQWVELQAWDLATNASAVGRTFGSQPTIAQHTEFLQNTPGNAVTLAETRHAQIEAGGGLVKFNNGATGLDQNSGPAEAPLPGAIKGLGLGKVHARVVRSCQPAEQKATARFVGWLR